MLVTQGHSHHVLVAYVSCEDGDWRQGGKDEGQELVDDVPKVSLGTWGLVPCWVYLSCGSIWPAG